jgi:hypothetical protein
MFTMEGFKINTPPAVFAETIFVKEFYNGNGINPERSSS